MMVSEDEMLNYEGYPSSKENNGINICQNSTFSDLNYADAGVHLVESPGRL